MDNLVEEYYKLVQLDKEYYNKYDKDNTDTIEGQLKNMLLNQFAWRQLTKGNEIEELQQAFNDKETMQPFLRLEDFYSDMVFDLEIDYLKLGDDISEEKIEELSSNKTLEKLLSDTQCPQQLKDCIKIYLMAEKICKNLYSTYKD